MGQNVKLQANTVHVGQSTWPAALCEVTAVVDTAIYAAGDVLTDVMTLSSALRAAGACARLRSIVVLDEADQTAFSFDVYFFKASQAMGTKNSAPNISDANMRDCLGFVSFATTDAKDVGASKIYAKTNLDLVLAATAGQDVFAVAVINAGTPTFATASDLKFKFGIEQH